MRLSRPERAVCQNPALQRLRLAAAAMMFALIGSLALADDASDAQAAAAKLNTEFDGNQMNTIYGNFAGDFARSKMTKDAFVSQLAVLLSTLGGPPLSRSIIQTQHAPDPATGKLLYSFRYKVVFPLGTVYEDLTLIKDDPVGWKLYGIFFNPAPTQ